jgi:Protein of unknown function (DUF1569)
MPVATCNHGVDACSPIDHARFGLEVGPGEVGTARRPLIDTGRVKNRRQVRYQSFDEFLADAERLAARPVREFGNWTLAQICDHLARSMNVSIDGTPERFPWALRITLRLARKRIIGHPMKPGYHVPENVAALLRPETAPCLRESVCKLRSAAARFQSASEFPPHPAFGMLRRDEYQALALRHAELHLSFIEPT